MCILKAGNYKDDYYETKGKSWGMERERAQESGDKKSGFVSSEKENKFVIKALDDGIILDQVSVYPL